MASARRGSTSSASRSARATALNAASATWCAFTPDSISTCSVSPPFIANAVKNSRTSSVSKRADFWRGEFHVPYQKRTPGNIKRGSDQRIVHRQKACAVPPDALLVANRFLQCLSKAYAHILNCVVVVDMQIALCPDLQIDQCVARQLIEHMIKKTDTGLIVILTRPVEIDRDRNVRLSGGTFDSRLAHCPDPIVD